MSSPFDLLFQSQSSPSLTESSVTAKRTLVEKLDALLTYDRQYEKQGRDSCGTIEHDADVLSHQL